MNEYQVCALLGIAVFLLRRTDFVFWYSRQFGLVDAKYLKARKEGENFLDWLNKQRDNFWTELLICPYCLSTWLALIPTSIYNWSNAPYYWLGIVGVYVILAFSKAALTKWA